MSTTQLIAIIIAIVTSNGLWAFIESRYNRKDKLADEEQKSIEDFEHELSMCSSACRQMLAYILIPWQDRIMMRDEEFIGVHEHEVMSSMCDAFFNLGGNNTVKHRWEFVKEFKKVPDIDIIEGREYNEDE